MAKKNINEQKFKGIEKRISGIIAIIVCVCSIILGVMGGVLSFRSAISAINETINDTSYVASEYVAAALREYVAVAYETGSIARLADPERDVRDKMDIIQQRVNDHNFTDGMILDANGVNIFDNTNLSDRDYFQACMKGETYISTPAISNITNAVSFVVAAPLWEGGIPDTEVVGVIVYIPNGEFLNDIMRSIQVGDHGTAFMVDSSGTTIADIDSSSVGVENGIEDAKNDRKLKSFGEVIEKMITGADGVGTYTYGGVTKIASYSPIPDTNGWSICVSAQRSDFLKEFYISIVIIGVLIVGFSLIGIYIGKTVGKRISKPILKVVDRLKLFSEGDLHTEVQECDSNDETKVLTESLKITIENINEIVEDIRTNMSELSSGNFAIDTDKTYDGDFSEISNSIKNIVDALNETMREIDANAEMVNTGSADLANASQQLAEGASDQASSIEELTATITDISEKINNNSTNANQAKETVDVMVADIMNSNEYMSQMSNAMTEINETSEHVSELMKTIEDIAGQTNLLSLNAAIEAARAGEAGKGFAVVADQVRNLAEQSAEAVRNSTVLIQDSIAAVNKGSDLAKVTADSLQVVIDKSGEIKEAVTDIANASFEQAGAAEQITMGVNQISVVVESNSATAEETSASSQQLSAQAMSLKSVLERFKLK